MKQYGKSIALFLAFACLTTMALGIIPIAAAGGPTTGNLLIRIYYDPTQEENALAAGDVDINDWPLTSTFITGHASDPAITMNSYAEIGEMEFDINNQLWPTGPATAPRTGVKNVFYDPDDPREIAALHFRRALAHLTNRDKYITTYLGGYGYAMYTKIPVPALEGYTDYSTLVNATALADAGPGGYLYPYDRAAAIAEFELGGFSDWDGDTWREWSGDGGTTYEELPNMKFWIRLDDPNRRQAGEDLYNEMVTVGIQEAAGAGTPGLEKQISERSTCFTQVMVLYNYNIYTGGWSMTADIDWLFDFMHSSMGQYGYANNYPGFKNAEYDYWAEKVKYPLTLADVRPAAIQAQWLYAKYVPVIDLWAAKGVKAYRTGWTGPVNTAGFGTDNGFSFQLMNWTDGPGTSRTGPANTIVYGFKSDLSGIHVLCSEWLWDWNVLGLIFDTLIGSNPYNLPDEIGYLATSWSSTNNYPGWVGMTVAEFTLRTDALFHDGSPVKPADVAYSILAVKAAGAGNAWNYPTVMDVNKVEIQGQTIRVFFNVASAWATHWAGFLPIINKDLWDDAIGVGGFTTAGYTGFIPDDVNGEYLPGTYANPAAVRAYHPWESTAAGNPAVNDLSEDGGFIYSFVSYTAGNNVALSAFTGYYTTITWHGTNPTVAAFIPKAFHGIGNVNYAGAYGVTQGWYTADETINLPDLTKIATSMPSSSGMPWGPGQSQFNPDADSNSDNLVNIIDLVTAGSNFNKKQG